MQGHVCVRESVCLCIYVCTYVWMYVRTYVRMYVCTYTYTHVYIQLRRVPSGDKGIGGRSAVIWWQAVQGDRTQKARWQHGVRPVLRAVLRKCKAVVHRI